MTMSEPGPAEREEQLVKLRRRMGKALRRGETAEFDRLSAVYARRKAEHVTAVHAEHMAERRAARAAQRAQEAQERAKPWRLPYGFSSPLAAQRARSGVRPREEPSMPAGGLRPWRRSWSPMSEQIWRPGP
jgi:hypothetical protein